MLIITDILKKPFDEGAKNAAYNLLKQLKQCCNCLVFSVGGDKDIAFVDEHYILNKMLFKLSFYKKISQYPQKRIIYLPEASFTLGTVIRSLLLKIFTGKKVTVIALQRREYSNFVKVIIFLFKPDRVISLSSSACDYLKRIRVESKILYLGVDDTKYVEYPESKRNLLRDKYRINRKKTVILHVGHIKRSRNLDWFIRIKAALPNLEIVIVCSTYSLYDQKIYDSLIRNGIIVINEYLPNIAEIYNISNYYVFPVIKCDGAIETPLSILEAMACNIPIITTSYGSIPDMFTDEDDFFFVTSCQDVIDILANVKITKSNNRSKVMPYTWKEVTKQLEKITE